MAGALHAGSSKLQPRETLGGALIQKFLYLAICGRQKCKSGIGQGNCDVLDVKAVVCSINDKGLVAGDAAGVTSVGGAQQLPCARHSCFKYLTLSIYVCVYIYTYTYILLKCTCQEYWGGNKKFQMCSGREAWSESVTLAWVSGNNLQVLLFSVNILLAVFLV